MDTINGADPYGFFNKVLRPSFRLDHFGLVCPFIELEHLRADLLTRPATNALPFVDIYSPAHFLFLFLMPTDPYESWGPADILIKL
jgi:hypothetical protein